MIIPKAHFFLFSFAFPSFFFPLILRGQNIERANELYKNGAYAEAIPLLEAFLSKKTTNLAAKTKLANCYRILSRPEKAAPLQAQIVEDANAKPQDFLHYGESLMMLGKYDSAKIYFNQYMKLNPEDERGKLLLTNIDKVKKVQPLFPNVQVYAFSKNSDGDDNAPVIYRNGLVFASDRPQSFNILKEKNPVTGRSFVTVYHAEQTGDTAFTEPKEFSAKFSEINRNTSNASFTADGKRVYFCRNGNVPGRNGVYNMQIFTAESEDGVSWHHVDMLSFCTPENNYVYPAISPDGQKLFFAAERGDGLGGLDIYMTTRTKKGNWTKTENLGAVVNTPQNEGFPFVATDGKLYFCSKGHPTFGGYDIFVTQYDSTKGEWLKPVNVGPPINSSYDDISICFDKRGQRGAFTSMRGGRGDDIFLIKMNGAGFMLDYPMVSNEPIGHEARAENKTLVQNTGGQTHQKTYMPPTVLPEQRIPEPKRAEPTAKKTYLDRLQNLMDNDKLRPNKSFVMESIHFPSETSETLTPDMAARLDELVEFLKKNRKLVVEIVAHTEGGLKDDKLAKTISVNRAQAIVTYIISQGIKDKRITANGLGRSRPIKDCREGGCTPEEDRVNRRVELKIKDL
jgi:outer membrane protein OmpA-like peptidoglycan-associated protein